MSDEGVHKETFVQQAHQGIPKHWVVFWWPENVCPASNLHEAAYFENLDSAIAFEKTLEPYEDWYDGQEIPLAVQ